MIQKHLLIATLTFLSCIGLFATTRAQAQSSRLDEPYFGAALMLGFLGNVEVETEEVRLGGTSVMASSSNDEDPEASIGAGLSYMRPLHRYFALGGRFAVQSWRSEADGDGGRNLLFELALVPQLRLPLSRSVELYFSLPIGLSLDFLNEVESSTSTGLFNINASVEADPGFGWNVAAMLGTRVALSDGFGLFAEIGYRLHSFSHDIVVSGGVGGIQVSGDTSVSITLTQLALNLGLYF